jgi:hypothetical protein
VLRVRVHAVARRGDRPAQRQRAGHVQHVFLTRIVRVVCEDKSFIY